MNSTEDSSTTDASQHLAGFAISFGVSITVLVLIIIIVIAAYLYRRKHIPSDTSYQSSLSSDDQDSTIEIGLDEATFHSYPKLIYSQAKILKGDSIASYCSICLAGYKDNDLLRLIPECDHLFHLKCIDQWLRQILRVQYVVAHQLFPLRLPPRQHEESSSLDLYHSCTKVYPYSWG